MGIRRGLAALVLAGGLVTSSYALKVPENLTSEGKTYFNASESEENGKTIVAEEYDSKERLTKLVVEYGKGVTSTINFSYDSEGRTLEKVITNNPKMHERAFCRTIYDIKGREVESLTDYGCDGTIDEITRVLKENGKTISLIYDSKEKLLQIYDENKGFMANTPFSSESHKALNKLIKNSKNNSNEKIETLLDKVTSLPQIELN